MPPESGTFDLNETIITVEDSGEMIFVYFTNLHMAQNLAETCSFSFVWHTEQREVSFSTHVDFYRAHLGKEVTISVGDVFTFKGFITSISCLNQTETDLSTQYQVSGLGLFAKLDETVECNSFYHKSISDIFNALNTAQQTTLRLSPTNTGQLFYHVQYNTSTFNFYKMMAMRYGEWLYYDGEALVMEAPTGEAVELVNGIDVQHLHINAAIRKATTPGIGYDQYSGEILENTPSDSSTSGMTEASLAAADSNFAEAARGRRIATAPTAEVLRDINTLLQRAATAATVFLEGTTRNPAVKLGKKIRIMDIAGNSEGEYIVTQIVHNASNANNYQNHFIAVPADVQVPPYTNPLIYPICSTQPAIVVDNVDADGLDRIKVRFPWMQANETSPWISVMVPYAGNGRGMRFVPEIDEEVMIDFVDNNAERPIMIGSFYTTANPSGVPHEGNNVKVFGTRSGRRIEINDEEGTLKIIDNYSDQNPLNGIQLNRSDSQQNMMLETKVDNRNYTVIRLNKDENISMGVVNGGTLQTEIRLLKDGPEIKINSKGTVSIHADGNINVKAGGSLKLEAGNKVEIKGDMGVEIKGMEIKGEADTNLELKGINAKIEGTVMLEAKGGALASLQGAIVKIN